MASLEKRYTIIRERITAAAQRAGRNPEHIQLVAVSKGRSLAEIYDLQALGQQDFGENRAEEGSDKINAARRDHKLLTWHMIGHVQRRKARDIAADFDWVHSLDGLSLAERLSRTASESGKVIPVLLECNTSGEASKYGLAADRFQSDPAQWEALCRTIESILAQPNLQVRGLMTMAPVVPEPALARPVFQQLQQLRDRLAGHFAQVTWDVLSMGMTDDFEVAIEEGATLVRIGRAIFAPGGEI